MKPEPPPIQKIWLVRIGHQIEVRIQRYPGQYECIIREWLDGEISHCVDVSSLEPIK